MLGHRRLRDLLAERPGATDEAIRAAEEELGRTFPEDLRALLRQSDGIEGFVSADRYIALWSARELVDLNAGYSVKEFAPGLVLIGSDGGGTGYGFMPADESIVYVRVPFDWLSIETIEVVGSSILDLLA